MEKVNAVRKEVNSITVADVMNTMRLRISMLELMNHLLENYVARRQPLGAQLSPLIQQLQDVYTRLSEQTRNNITEESLERKKKRVLELLDKIENAISSDFVH